MPEIKVNQTSEEDILKYLQFMDNHFIPPLHTVTDLDMYAKKLYELATRIEYYHDNSLSALLAVYFNSEYSFAFITTISVMPVYLRNGIAQMLLDNLILICRDKGIEYIDLEVNIQNERALKFYRKLKFYEIEKRIETLIFRKRLC